MHKIPDLIKDNTLLTWDEPRPGISPDGREITVNIRLQMAARDAIAYTRASMPQYYKGMSDRQILADFIEVNLAATNRD